jgi:PIN domain nuclease of toxin-antitoxin system
VNFLLDTHIILWALTKNNQLNNSIRESITDGKNLVYVSAASTWEIAIKQGIGKLRAPNDLLDRLAAARIRTLPISAEHGLAIRSLPFHHNDPFDRMLIAQAKHENLTLITNDRQIQRYDVKILPA